MTTREWLEQMRQAADARVAQVGRPWRPQQTSEGLVRRWAHDVFGTFAQLTTTTPQEPDHAQDQA